MCVCGISVFSLCYFYLLQCMVVKVRHKVSTPMASFWAPPIQTRPFHRAIAAGALSSPHSPADPERNTRPRMTSETTLHCRHPRPPAPIRALQWLPRLLHQEPRDLPEELPPPGALTVFTPCRNPHHDNVVDARHHNEVFGPKCPHHGV